MPMVSHASLPDNFQLASVLKFRHEESMCTVSQSSILAISCCVHAQTRAQDLVAIPHKVRGDLAPECHFHEIS